MQLGTLLLLSLLAGTALSARILGILPSDAHSHQMPYLVVLRALAERGHNVTVLTPRPLKDPPKNLKQIASSSITNHGTIEKMTRQLTDATPDKIMEVMMHIAEDTCNDDFNLPEIKELLESDDKFDLVILETFIHWCYYGFIYKLGSPPVVGFFSVGINDVMSSVIGNPINPAYMPGVTTAHTNHMTFWERMLNTYYSIQFLRSFYNFQLPFHERVIQNHFGKDVPRLSDMLHNMSLLVTANHFSLSYPQPLLPNVIEVTGLHINNKRTPLPKELQRFLDGATNGFIYFSLGSNLKSSNLPETVRSALMEAFSELPQRVLWKFEQDDLPEKPDNVMIAKWLPQLDVLAHPNIRLFFTHGGVNSFSEATYFAVPLVAMPFFGDQRFNLGKMMAAGVGEKLEFDQISKDSVQHAIQRVISNPSYKENMNRLSAVYREHQETSVDRAAWWIEYVIRHKGAPHLRSAALDLHWWQLLLLDVIGFILAVAAIAVFLLYKVTRFIVRVLRNNKAKTD